MLLATILYASHRHWPKSGKCKSNNIISNSRCGYVVQSKNTPTFVIELVPEYLGTLKILDVWGPNSFDCIILAGELNCNSRLFSINDSKVGEVKFITLASGITPLPKLSHETVSKDDTCTIELRYNAAYLTNNIILRFKD
jgi:hypothetical protein